MAEQRERRPATILAADIVGYSRLMERDEFGTLRQLDELREKLLKPKLDGCGGRLFHTAGDSFLVEFSNSEDAMRCGIDIQRALLDGPDDDRAYPDISLRIGVHAGEVIDHGQDLYGDCINVAARLESIAAAGGLCVSHSVWNEIRTNFQIEMLDGGERTLKNIERPVRVWYWPPKLPDPTSSINDEHGRWRAAIAVLPFVNLSGDPDQEYFADGLTDDITTALTLWRRFPVVARNSSFAFKGKALSISEIAKELGADYIIEGTVRKSGQRVRIAAQLVDSQTGHQIWAERYDRNLEDIFEVQDDLTRRISAVLAPEVSRAELKRLDSRHSMDGDAWDYYLRGQVAMDNPTLEAFEEAREFFQKAISLDPSYSNAYTGLGMSLLRLARIQSGTSSQEAVASAKAASQKAIDLDPQSSLAYHVLSTAHIMENAHEQSLAAAHKAAELNPNDPLVVHGLGNKSDLAGDPEGISRMEFAQRMNPRDPSMSTFLTFLARAYIVYGDYDRAIEKARAAISQRPELATAHFILAIALAHGGRNDEANLAIEKCEQLDPHLIKSRENWTPYTDPARNAHLMSGLAKARGFQDCS